MTTSIKIMVLCYCYYINIMGLCLVYITLFQKLKILYIILKIILRVRYYTISMQIRIKNLAAIKPSVQYIKGKGNIIPRQNRNFFFFFKYNHQGIEFERASIKVIK